MNHTIIGVFENEDLAEDAIHDLKNHGYPEKELSIIVKDTNEHKDIEESTGAKLSEGASAGAEAGAVVGAIAGLLAGLGAIAIPGGLFIGGPILAVLGITGAAGTTISGAAAGAIAGGIIGALTRLGIPEQQAKSYESALNKGGILIAVPTTIADQETEAKNILLSHGATQITDV